MKIFGTFFECSGQNLSNFLCQFWNDNSIPLQILYLSSVSWKITPLYFFSSNNTYFAQKEPIKVKIFETFECSSQILCLSSVSWKICPLYFFSSNNIYFAQKEPIKMKILGLCSSSQVKICQIFYVNFETTSQFLPKFCIPLQFHERYVLYTFLAQTIYTLLKRSPLKWKFWDFLRVLRSKFVKFFMSILKQQVNSSPSFVSLFSFMKDYSSVLFSSNNIYFAQKEPIKMKMFETFKCLGQILSNSLHQFWNDEWIPLQILYPPSVSWKITPLNFFLAKTIHS